MKTQIQISTGSFEYIMREYDTEMTPEAAVEAYRELQRAYKGGEGLTDKEIDLIIENMCLQKTTENGTELWAKATDTQKKEINRLKRALNRIKSRNGEDEIE